MPRTSGSSWCKCITTTAPARHHRYCLLRPKHSVKIGHVRPAAPGCQQKICEMPRHQAVNSAKVSIVSGPANLPSAALRQICSTDIPPNNHHIQKSVANGMAKVPRDLPFMFDGQIGNATPRIKLIGRTTHLSGIYPNTGYIPHNGRFLACHTRSASVKINCQETTRSGVS